MNETKKPLKGKGPSGGGRLSSLSAPARIGKRGVALAIAATIVLPLALSLMFYPAAHMELKGLPFGILSLDAGVQTPAGEMNAGEAMVEKIESGGLAGAMAGSDAADGSSALSDAVEIRAFDSQEDLDRAFEGNELYGAIVIPEDFSALQAKYLMSAQPSALGDGAAALAGQQAGAAEQDGMDAMEKPSIQVIIDYAKSPMVASQMQAGMASALSAWSDQVDVDVVTINEGPAADGVGGGNPMGGMLSQMVVLMPLLICSVIAGVFAVKGLGVRDRESASKRVRAYAATLAVDAVAAAALSLMLYWVISCVAGLPADFAGFFGYCWLSSFFLMAFFGGLACIRGRLAVPVGVLIVLLGLTSGYLPVEAMPTFWVDWVVPWAPEYYLGNGLRDVVFAGGGIWNEGTACVGVYALVGLCAAAFGIGIAGRSGKEA